MSELRIRGQEITLRLTRGNIVQRTITAIKDFTAQLDFEKSDEGYLGETTNRKDDIFNGASGSFTVDAEGQDLFLFCDFVKRKAQRKLPVNQDAVNMSGRFAFPNGDTPKLQLKDLKFGPMPIGVPGRTQYVNTAFDYSTDDITFLTT